MWKTIADFVKNVFDNIMNSKTFEKGAALSYYAVFSFLPMILIIVTLVGFFFGKEAVSGEIFYQIEGFLGEEGVTNIQQILEQREQNENSILLSILGFLTLGFTATGMLNQIQNSFNEIWNLKAKPNMNIKILVTNRLVSFGALLFIGLVLFLSALLSSGIQAFASLFPEGYQNLYIYEFVVSFIVLTAIFAMMFKQLGNANVPLKTALVSGAFTSILFTLGEIGISFYLSQVDVSSSFGSAGFLAVLMVWVYYSSQIIFIGAAFALEYGRVTDQEVCPDSTAMRVKYVVKEQPEDEYQKEKKQRNDERRKRIAVKDRKVIAVLD